MRKQRAQTLQQRMGFSDEDLKTPQHDAIMVWLQENVAEVCAQVLGVDKPGSTGWNPEYVSEMRRWANELIRKEVSALL